MNYVCRFLRRNLGGFGEARLVLNLRPGETVQVREEQEILRTLDQEETLEGLPFTHEMRDYCGGRLKVLKRVNKMLVEGETVMKELRNTSQNFSEVSLAFGCLSVSVHGSMWDVTGVLEDTYRITRQLIHKTLNERCCKKVRFH